MRIFLRPDFRKKHYGKLSAIAAIEPPARMLQMSGRYDFIDEETGGEIPADTTHITLCPHGNYPFAIFQNMRECQDKKKTLSDKYDVNILDRHENLHGEIPYHKIDLKKYRPHLWHSMTGAKKGYATTFLSTSCKYNCKFCYVKKHYGSYFERDVEQAAADVINIFSYGVRNIKMLDEIFLTDTSRVRRFLDWIRPIGQYLNIWGYARVDTINEDIVKCARESGVRWLAIGIESANRDTRIRLGKGKFTNQDIIDVVNICESNGVQVMANYMFGLDGETIKDEEGTKEFALKLNTAFMNIYSYTDEKGKGGLLVGERRNKFFNDYFTNPSYTKKVKIVLGDEALDKVKMMLSFGR